jgi:hypothetical protein
MSTTLSQRPGPTTAPTLADLQLSVERMRTRVRSTRAHEAALRRAGDGIGWVHTQLTSILDMRVARAGWTAENRLAQSALEAMDHQLRVAGSSAPLERLRLSLDHALFRADDAIVLLRDAARP